MAADGRLTRTQARAIPALLAARTLAEAASTAEVGERSLRRWLTEDDTFRTEYLNAARRTGYAATASLLAAQHRAIEVLVSALADESSATRVRAPGCCWSTAVTSAPRTWRNGSRTWKGGCNRGTEVDCTP